ncbi:MAG: nucleotide exchange factor GrpE [Bacteroidota bacterium]|nr:nucleotide exchange factor GrpE [Bacteroidota bacterium]
MAKKSEKKKEEQEEILTENQEVTAEKADSKQKEKEKKSSSKKDKKSKEKKQLEELEQQLAEQKDKFIRLYSEFENYRRRTSKEKLELSKTASEGVITSLLPVMDDFDRAYKFFENSADEKTFKEGVDLISDKLFKIMKQKGLTEIESNGKEFDTDLHEAITKIPAPSDDLKGKVIDTTEKGYTIAGKVIRFAKVVVGS